jgi:hypothetical protein
MQILLQDLLVCFKSKKIEMAGSLLCKSCTCVNFVLQIKEDTNGWVNPLLVLPPPMVATTTTIL